MTVEFKFTLLQAVKIIEGGRTGKVVGLFIDRDKIKFIHVEWINDVGSKTMAYFREDEVERK